MLIWPGIENMTEVNDCTFELRASAFVKCGWRKALPDYVLACCCCHEEVCAGTETIAFLKKLIE